MATNRVFSFFLAFTIIIISGPLAAQEASRSETVHVSDEGKVQRWRTSTILTDFNIESRGRIELTDDDKDVKSMSEDGYLEITKTVFGSKRRIIIESLGGGKLKKEYYEGRTQMDWNQNGKTWLAEVLPEVVRSSTIGAEGRVNRYFRQGGSKGVLDEINRLDGDYTRAHYAKLLLQKQIPANETAGVIERLADAIDSDYYLTSVLKDSMEKLLVSKESGDAFFKASEKISSDYYKSVVLKAGLKKYSASPEQVKSILRAASGINSDYYLSVVLTTLLEEGDVKEVSLEELMNVSRNISSDYYRSEVLRKAVQKPGLSLQAQKNAISAVADVGSDYYKTGFFNTLIERGKISSDLQPEIIRIINESVESDYYASATLSKMLKHQQLSDAAFEKLVLTAGNLSSSNYACEVLKSAGEQDLSKKQILMILKASTSIDSDHYLSTVLQAVAPKVKSGDSELKDAYRQAAKEIGSETYYARAVRMID